MAGELDADMPKISRRFLGMGDLASFPLGSGGIGPSADLLSLSAGGTGRLSAGGLESGRGPGETDRGPSSTSMGSGSA